MKQVSTLLLRIAVIIMGLVVLALCILVLPVGVSHEDVGGYLPILIGMYVTALPFFVALYHTLKLLNYIDRGTAFSQLSVKALKYIKFCALVVSFLYTAGLPYIYLVAQEDDAPGVVAIGLIIAFASTVIAILAAILQKLLRSAIDIKSENDLTV